MKPDQERVKNLLVDTVTLLCKNGLNFRKELKVQGLLGITLDDNDVFIVHINEILAAADDVTTVQEVTKETSTKLKNAATSGEKAIGHSSVPESLEKSLHESAALSSNVEMPDLASVADAACAIVKIEQIDSVPQSAVEQHPRFDEMVDFSSFLPDFSSARYPSELSSLHHGNMSLPSLPSSSDDPTYPTKRKRVSGHQLDKLSFLPNSSEGECSDGRLATESSSVLGVPGLSFHSRRRVRRSSASSLPKNSELLLDQNVVDIGSAGLSEEYSRAVASSFFPIGVECSGQSSQGFDSQQLMSMNYRWKRRSQHSLEKPFHCTVPGCSRSYWNMPDLYRHRKMNHGICGRAHARKKAAELDLQINRPST